MNKTEYDIIVIGGAAAGLTAGLFAARRGWRVALVTVDIGGQMTLTDHISNYPGITHISGTALAQTMVVQMQTAGVTTIHDRVVSIAPTATALTVATATSQFITRAVILAFGLSPRLLEVSGEAALVGRGVSYGLGDDLALHRGKTVGVVGGGNSAVTTALALASVAQQIYLLHRRAALRADQSLIDQLTLVSNITVMLSTEVVAVAGADQLTEISIQDINGNRSLACNHLIVQIGFGSQTDWLESIVRRDAQGMIVIDDRCRTSHPGIFAAGDATTIPYRQIVISAGEGAKAALAADQYLRGTATQPIIPDWK